MKVGLFIWLFHPWCSLHAFIYINTTLSKNKQMLYAQYETKIKSWTRLLTQTCSVSAPAFLAFDEWWEVRRSACLRDIDSPIWKRDFMWCLFLFYFCNFIRIYSLLIWLFGRFLSGLQWALLVCGFSSLARPPWLKKCLAGNLRDTLPRIHYGAVFYSFAEERWW